MSQCKIEIFGADRGTYTKCIIHGCKTIIDGVCLVRRLEVIELKNRDFEDRLKMLEDKKWKHPGLLDQ